MGVGAEHSHDDVYQFPRLDEARCCRLQKDVEGDDSGLREKGVDVLADLSVSSDFHGGTHDVVGDPFAKRKDHARGRREHGGGGFGIEPECLEDVRNEGVHRGKVELLDSRALGRGHFSAGSDDAGG